MKLDGERSKRRTWLGSMATLGTAVAGTFVLAKRGAVVEPVAAVESAATEAAPTTGYQLTEHVKRYYATTRV